ncbi:hypothetical protein, partial [Mucilaginibacter gossypiicola]|uniref:hypothetical protein n=1 Tax=Mucilaginibacter gossypiicola TaxID=551995 RepID=UPI001AD7F8B8
MNLRENNSICCFCLFQVSDRSYCLFVRLCNHSPIQLHQPLTLFLSEESFGQLVLLGYDVTTFIPVTYQRSS